MTILKTTVLIGAMLLGSAANAGWLSAEHNYSPIRGKGRIVVVHNEPAPGDPDAEIAKAAWLLKDNGWQVFKPNGRRQ